MMRRHSHAWPWLAGLAFALIVSRSAGAWGHEGHRTIGAIADALLVGTHAEAEIQKILGAEKLETAALWADCAKGVSDNEPFKYHVSSRFPECAPFEQSAEDRQEMEGYVRRNSTACHPLAGQEICHKQYHYADVAIEHSTYERADVGTSDHDIVSAIKAATAKLRGEAVPAPFSLASRKEALRVLAHFVGDVHQPLHVGAIYLDAAGNEENPDAGSFDPGSTTRGGNLLMHGRRKLHGEWDLIPRRLSVREFLTDGVARAKLIPVTTGSVLAWPAAWASESIGVSQTAFAGLSFGAEENAGTHRAEWPVQEPVGYTTHRAALQKEQLVRAGARLAQLLQALFP
jgi:S1/P1 Nuclease